MTRCSKCKYGNLVKVSKNLWMIECNALPEDEQYITLDNAELDELPCDMYDENGNDDTAA